ncbi:hypothetical protein BURMUCGD2M_6697 [Burkholderia multivorans CGD2M]|nr:hypothetical protein BURMUCGD2M_6697 [Burkholderia multivorans CGD2M]
MRTQRNRRASTRVSRRPFIAPLRLRDIGGKIRAILRYAISTPHGTMPPSHD